MSFSARGEALLAKLRQDRLSDQKQVFGPNSQPPSKDIFQRKWCGKLNAQLRGMPQPERQQQDYRESILPYYSQALDLSIAFRAEALALGYTVHDFESKIDFDKNKGIHHINCASPFDALSALAISINLAAKLCADDPYDVLSQCEGSEQEKLAVREQAEDFLVKVHEAVEAGVWETFLPEDMHQKLDAESQQFKPTQHRAGTPKWW
ncbi:hypothetical protein AC578_9692 [Pseudocercospora eumusae]|uniref:Uncharacterized protein n=1 Tax=Pseudocercospora eumusae TaxID=321146 RepID=A0A139HQI8_9PEZI|nr:hypothetical protein AC578_9692 [Pseudocercospora eumusae]